MKAIIFDLDGTLIDSVPDIHAAVSRTLHDEGVPPLSIRTVRSFVGNGVPTLIDKVMEARGEGADPARRAALIARFMRHYEAASTDLTTVYPNVKSALLALHGAGHPIGLCTNKPEAIARDILQGVGLIAYFQAIIGGDSLPERKPHPAPLLETLRVLGAEEAIYVGDSEVDAETAQAAGIPLLLFTEGYRKTPIEDLVHHTAFSDFAELPGIVVGIKP